MFIFVRYALIFCGVALVLAMIADALFLLVMTIVARNGVGGVGFVATRSGWITIFALWWLVSFLVALPVTGKLARLLLPFRLF